MRYLGLSLLLLGASALHANSFTFTFSGGNVSATGSLTANSMGAGLYDVSSITGTLTVSAGKTNSSYNITESPLGNLGALVIDQTGANGSVVLGAGGITFGVGNGIDAVAYVGSSYTSALSGLSTGNGVTSGTNFTIADPGPTGVPEPSTLLIFLTLGIVAWAFGRKLPTRFLPK